MDGPPEVAKHGVVIFYAVVELLFFVFLGWIILKNKRDKKKVEKAFHAPEMEDVRNLYKPFLKEHGIKVDGKHYEKN